MSDFFEWEKDTLKELAIKDHEFFDYLKAGLQPYTKLTKKPIPCPREHHKYYDQCEFFSELKNAKELVIKKGKAKQYEVEPKSPLYKYFSRFGYYHFKEDWFLYVSYRDVESLEELTSEDYNEYWEKMGCDPADKANLQSWRFLDLPETETECEAFKSGLTDKAVFSKAQAQEIRSRLSIDIQKKLADRIVSEPEVNEKPEQHTKPTVSFYKDGDYWRIGDKSDAPPIKHSVGLTRINFLLRYEWKEFKPLDVEHFGNVPETKVKKNRVPNNVTKIMSMIDKLRCLREAEEDVDGRIEIDHKMAELDEELNFCQEFHNCRTKIYSSLKRALNAVYEVPRMDKILRPKDFKFGNTFSYRPQNKDSVNWILDKPSS